MANEKDWNDIGREQGPERSRETFNKKIADAERRAQAGNGNGAPRDDDARQREEIRREVFPDDDDDAGKGAGASGPKVVLPPSPPPPPLSKTALTEQRIGRQFAKLNADKLRYNHSSDTWLIWNGNLWIPDGSKAVERLALDYVLSLHKEASPTREKRQFARNVCEVAAVMLPLATEAKQWDCDPWLLGTPGGVVDLRTGKMRAGRPGDMISKSTAVAPSEHADCPQWIKFLRYALNNDEELIGFLQRYCGYCLTGLTREEVLTYLAGKEGTGKGTFTKTIYGIMFDYAGIVPVTMFTDPNWRALEYYRAQLPGLRLVLASEPGQDTQWNEGFVNEITGSDRLSARHPRGKPFTYDPTHKLMMHGNSVPDLKGAPSGIRRRLRITLFDRAPIIPDPTLKDKLRKEWPGILRWMINGCLAWQTVGLDPPEAVTEATKDYFEQQDTFARFVADDCDLLPSAKLPPDKVRSAYNAWADKNGEPKQSTKTFYKTVKFCRLPNVKQGKTNGVRWIQGIALKPKSAKPAKPSEPEYATDDDDRTRMGDDY